MTAAKTEQYTMRLTKQAKSWLLDQGGSNYIEHLASGTTQPSGRGSTKESHTDLAYEVLNDLVNTGKPFRLKVSVDHLRNKLPYLTQKAALSACQRALGNYFSDLPYQFVGKGQRVRLYNV